MIGTFINIFEQLFKKSKDVLFFFILFSVLTFIYSGCAKQVPPSGGPVDKTPPTVVATIPFDGTTDFKGDELSVTFSEYIDKNSFRNAFFISPVVRNMKYDWSGKTVTISFHDSLKKNTTYSVIIGTDVKDLNNRNKMALPYAFSFSTGDKIDKGEISGKVFDSKPQGITIFIYKNLSDTITPAIVKPNYISQSGKNGEYLVTGLGDGSYRAFAVRDKNSNLLWDSENEEIGIQFKPIALADSTNIRSGVDFQLTVMDTSKPALLEATMTDRNHILSVFSKRIDSSKISSGNFSIIDSTNKKTYPVLYVYNKKRKGSNVLLEISDSLKDDRLFLTSKNIIDYYGNKSGEEETEFYYNGNPDTVKPKIEKVILPFDKYISFTNPSFIIRFSEGVCSGGLASSVLIHNEAGENVNLSVSKINDAEFVVALKEQLHPNEKINLKISMDRICDAAGNKGDSTYEKEINTINDLAFVTISGKALYYPVDVKNYVALKSLDKKRRTQKALIGKSGKYILKQVLPGKYFVWAFSDKNSNGKYDFGNVVPVEFAEPFYFRPDTLIVRKRWPIKNVNVKFK